MINLVGFWRCLATRDRINIGLRKVHYPKNLTIPAELGKALIHRSFMDADGRGVLVP